MPIEWTYPSALWLLAAVPALALLLVWRAFRRADQVRDMGRSAGRMVAGRRRVRLQSAAALAAMLLLAVAAAGPRIGEGPSVVAHEGLDLVIVLDVSRSMLAQDVAPSRLQRSIHELRSLIAALQGDRAGLILFAGTAEVVAPLTHDVGHILAHLERASTEAVDLQGTNIPAALTAAHLSVASAAGPAEGRMRSRVVLLLSDGENHEPGLEQALRRLEDEEIVLMTVGVGTAEGAPVPSAPGAATYHTDASGQVVRSALVDRTLREIGGDRYLHLAAGQTLAPVRAALDELERAASDATVFARYRHLYQVPLFLAVCLILLDGRLRSRRRKRQEVPA
jgi:Ca-activated chloride channel homolog